MSIVSQGRFIGKDSSFKYRKSGGIGSGIKLSAQRKDSLEKRAIDDKQNKEVARTKEVSRREKERKQRQIKMVKRVSEETNTEKRQKVVAVGRPDTAKTPLDANSKLYKQSQIKNKIIDENEVKSMTFQKYHNLPDSLVSAVTSVLEKAKNPFQDDDKKAKSKKDDDDQDDDMKSKKNDADDEDEDDSERMVGKSGKKTKVELNPKTNTTNEELKGKQHKLDKNKNGRLDAHDFKLLRKEEVEAEHIAEDKTHTVWFQKGTKIGARSARGVGVTANSDKHAIELAKKQFSDHKDGWFVSKIKSHAKEEVENIDELSNKTLRSYSVGASRHLMDIKPAWTKPSEYQNKAAVGAHGKTAQKRAQGLEKAGEKIKQNIAKTNASVKEEVTLSDEETLRILAKLKESDDKAYKYRDVDPADKDTDYKADKDKNPEHIVMQLRKAKSLGAANVPIHFHDGSKVKVNAGHVQKALDMHGSFKKAPDKDDFTQKLQASHASFKKALGEQ